MDIKEIRLINLNEAIKIVKTQANLAAKTNIKTSYFSQIKNPKHKTKMGDDVARRIEKAINKPHGWMDQLHNDTEGSQSNKTGEDSADIYKSASPEARKLFEIIDAADRAMNDSGHHFTDEERIENYFAALDFAGRKHFSNELINQYLSEMMSRNVGIK